MATNSVKVTLQIRHDEARDWETRNPILAEGEFGLETDTFLIKVGNGNTAWNNLRYLNKLNPAYFKWDSETNQITFSDAFLNMIATLEASAGQAIEHLTITEPPIFDTDVPNKKYVDDAIANAGHLKRLIVENLPSAASADPNTLYMVLAPQGDHYEEYMVINGVWDMVGSTGDGGSGGGFQLEVATTTRLGGVKASVDPNRINVTEQGFMTLNQVSTSLLYTPVGDTLIIHGGSA